MKVCFKCQKRKRLSSFYEHKHMSDGHLNKCKECTKADVHRHRIINLDKIQLYDAKRGRFKHRKDAQKKYQQTEPAKESQRKSSRRWGRDNRIKKNAHLKARRAVSSGEITKQPCQVCGNKKVHGHHEDYSKPLDVLWLCAKHHAELHRKYKEI